MTRLFKIEPSDFRMVKSKTFSCISNHSERCMGSILSQSFSAISFLGVHFLVRVSVSRVVGVYVRQRSLQKFLGLDSPGAFLQVAIDDAAVTIEVLV